MLVNSRIAKWSTFANLKIDRLRLECPNPKSRGSIGDGDEDSGTGIPDFLNLAGLPAL